MYAIYTTENFDKEIERLTLEEQRRIGKIFLQLRDNPYVGKQLQYKFLREKRLGEKRIYYLVYDNLKTVLIVAISGKRNQQETINHIINHFGEYQIYLEKILNKN